MPPRGELPANGVQSITSTKDGHTESYHTLSRFSEAMINPNWRSRNAGDQLQASVYPNPVSYRAACAFHHSSQGFRSTDSGLSSIFDESDSWERLEGATCANTMNGSDATGDPYDYSRSSHHTEENKNTFAGQPVEFGIESYRPLSGRANHGYKLSLLELSPLASNGRSDGEKSDEMPTLDTAKIQRFDQTMQRPVKREMQTEQRRHYMETLGADNAEPTQHQHSSTALHPSSTGLRVASPRHPHIEERTTLSDRSLEHTDHNQKGQSAVKLASVIQAKNTQLRGEHQNQAAKEKAMAAAFQKMLQKLQKGPAARKPASRMSHARGMAPVSQERTSHEHYDVSKTVPMWRSVDIRTSKDANSSDSGYGSLPSTRMNSRTACSHRSTLPRNTVPGYNSFNPKAREFCSMTADYIRSYGISVGPKTNHMHAADIFTGNEAEISNKRSTGGSADTEMMPQSSLIDSNTPTYNGFANGTIAPDSQTAPPGMMPPNSWSQVPSHLNGPTLPQQASFTTNVPCLAESWNGGVLVHQPAQVCAVSPPFFSQFMPKPSPVNIQASYNHLPHFGSLPAAVPAPVPKPRKPDPGDQQAYEAWIEWRKTNEPGYAMECKMRQQRRAQRNTARSSFKTVSKELPILAT